MTARDLFIIILKVFGIFLIKDLVISIVTTLSVLPQAFSAISDFGSVYGFLLLLSVGVYAALVYLLLFRAPMLVSKLGLAEDLTEGPLHFKLHRSAVLNIAFIVTGLVILVLAVPELVRQLLQWYSFNKLRGGLEGGGDYNYGSLLVPVVQVVLGLLFLGNARALVNFIEGRRRAAHND
jgi:hypothetical protein